MSHVDIPNPARHKYSMLMAWKKVSSAAWPVETLRLARRMGHRARESDEAEQSAVFEFTVDMVGRFLVMRSQSFSICDG